MNASKKRAISLGVRVATPGKKQERAIVTRKRLTDAAREVFARKGFENARVEDIAEAAGKTRGAFYANFADKEDVFFAIFEEDISRDREQFSSRLSEASSTEERARALALHLSGTVRDRPRMTLVLEFKHYAIRHPKKQKRLADLHAAMCGRCAETDLTDLIPEFTGLDAAQKRRKSAQVSALLDGLALNAMFDCDGLTDAIILGMLEANLRAVLTAS